jgi:hypothetical protein
MSVIYARSVRSKLSEVYLATNKTGLHAKVKTCDWFKKFPLPILLLAGFFSLVLGACLPNHRTYYEPHAEGGKLLRESKIILENDGVLVSIEAGLYWVESAKKALYTPANHALYITVETSGAKTSVDFRDFRIVDAKTGNSFLPTDIFQRQYGVSSQPIEIHERTSVSSQKNIFYGLNYEIPYSSLEHFTLQAFTVMSEDKQLVFPVVDFTRRSSWGVYAINY